MLVKNTIIALMVVAPVLSIPVPPTEKAAATVATTKATPKATTDTTATKATAAKPAEEHVSKAVAKAEKTVERDAAVAKRLRAQLKAAETKLAKDKKAEVSLEKKEKAAAKAKARKAKAAEKAAGKPTTKLSTKAAKSSTKPPTKAAEGGRRNKHNLQIDTTRHHHRHSRIGVATPGSGRFRKHRATTPGTAHSSKHSVSTPGTAKSKVLTPGTAQSKLTTPGTAQTPLSGPPTGFTGGFSSPGFSPPFTGNSLNGLTEDISWTPTKGGGYKQSISFKQPDSAKLTRRDLPPTPASSSPDAVIRKHRSRKSAKAHQHTAGEMMQLTAMLIEAEKVVNGLEEQVNKPATVFPNLKRKFKRPTTPAAAKAPVTPPATAKTT